MATTVAELTDLANDLREGVGAAMRALQFEDIATQLIGCVERRIKRVEGLTLDLERLTAAPDDVSTLEAAQTSIRERCAEVIRSPGEQESVHAGTVELF
jgi:methyl-accepting chemotaxis protein